MEHSNKAVEKDSTEQTSNTSQKLAELWLLYHRLRQENEETKQQYKQLGEQAICLASDPTKYEETDKAIYKLEEIERKLNELCSQLNQVEQNRNEMINQLWLEEKKKSLLHQVQTQKEADQSKGENSFLDLLYFKPWLWICNLAKNLFNNE